MNIDTARNHRGKMFKQRCQFVIHVHHCPFTLSLYVYTLKEVPDLYLSY
jgi:hypothetical protein